MSKKIFLAAAFIAIIACCASCVKYMFSINGNGVLATSEKTVSAFEKINVAGTAKVRFHASEDEYRVVVTVDENLYEYVEVFTKNNALNIRTKHGYSCSFTTFQVDVYCPSLRGVSMSGSGSFEGFDKITTSNFEATVSGSGKVNGTVECEKFTAKVSGSGRITIAGNSHDANIDISGSGSFGGSDFEIFTAAVGISGSGSANVWVTEYLKARISGSGVVNYRGEPRVETNISGSGRVRKQ